jgi:hypothetical protein
VRRSTVTRGVAGFIAIALLVLAGQQHRHRTSIESTKCVACAVRVQRATPPPTPVVVAAPVLVALPQIAEQDEQLPSLAAPTPRAQGPPSA